MNPYSRNLHSSSKTLYHNGDNQIIYCYGCEAFHLYYGTVSLDLYESAFISLNETLQNYIENYEGKISCNCRCIQVNTPYQGIRLYFSLSELQELCSIMKIAYDVYEATHSKARFN